MKLNQLHFFVAVYEEGSFSAGARRANATQSGLSMQIRDLEKRYDVKLLERSSTGVTPTEAGRVFYEKAVSVLRGAAEAEETLRRLAGEMSGQIRVGLIPTFTRSVLSPAVVRFSQDYPLVRQSVLEASSSQLTEPVARGDLDFALVPAFDELSAVRSTPLGTDREFLVGMPAAQHLQPVRLRDIQPLRLVLPSRSNIRRRRIDAYLAQEGIAVAELLELDAMLATLDLVAHSDWLAILPGILCAPDWDGARRCLRPIADPPLPVTYYRIEPAARPLSQAAEVFCRMIEEEFAKAMAIVATV
jgi:DNA-binding transcriptional LysR family regulator